MTKTEMENIAIGNIERNLGSCECADEDSIFDEAFNLAYDALVDKGVIRSDAAIVAAAVAQRFAQP